MTCITDDVFYHRKHCLHQTAVKPSHLIVVKVTMTNINMTTMFYLGLYTYLEVELRSKLMPTIKNSWCSTIDTMC